MDREWAPLASDFAEHPLSVTEVRANRSNRAADATARDVLVNLLRKIDNGQLIMTGAVVSYEYRDENGRPAVTYEAGGPGCERRTSMLGMLEAAKFQMLVED